MTNALKDTIFLEMRPDAKANVTVTRWQYVTLRDPKVYPHIKFVIPSSNNIRDCSGHDFSRIEARGQGQCDPNIVRDTPGPQGVSTN